MGKRGRKKGTRMLNSTLSYWKNFRVKDTDIKALKRFIDDPYSDSTLKIDLLGWMFDNLTKINIPQMRNTKFHQDVLTFLHLIENGR